MTPTLVVYQVLARERAGGDELPDEFVGFIDGTKRIALRLHRAGVRLLAGTDTSDLGEGPSMRPGEALQQELKLLQHAGIPAAGVIRIATANAARALGLDGMTGTIEAGKAADFLLLSEDPGSDISAVRSIVAVYRHGIEVSTGPR